MTWNSSRLASVEAPLNELPLAQRGFIELPPRHDLATRIEDKATLSRMIFKEFAQVFGLPTYRKSVSCLCALGMTRFVSSSADELCLHERLQFLSFVSFVKDSYGMNHEMDSVKAKTLKLILTEYRDDQN